MVVYTVSAAGVFLVIVVAVAVRVVGRRRGQRRRSAVTHHPITRSAPSTVRLLRGEEELQTAVDRAVATERSAAARASERADRIARLSPRLPPEGGSG